MDKLFIIKKRFMARSVQDALKKEKKKPVDEVYVDDDWLKANAEELIGNKSKKIGFEKRNG
jgi:hypothetical protein